MFPTDPFVVMTYWPGFGPPPGAIWRIAVEGDDADDGVPDAADADGSDDHDGS